MKLLCLLVTVYQHGTVHHKHSISRRIIHIITIIVTLQLRKHSI